ncbi:unnamed protein product [Phytophthora lilii]|uniref:Unnamed protein product n=1 Tax=Phytophthora lilii TaxID=2077276 RepID=A0A9W7DAU0_9STRA|nr:unnamed protein product [Phytophthora lilii]
MELEVSRILTCSSHYEVLGLNQPDGKPVFVDALQVRRRYKELAIRVHPDKNRADGNGDRCSVTVRCSDPVVVTVDAEAAFKRLSEAYECLVDEASQHRYLQTLQRQSAAVKHQTTNKPKPKYRRKRKASPQPQTEENTSLPTRRRTPEEIWQQFQREEEEMARQQFHANGFDRVYESRPSSERGINSSPPAVSAEKQQEILSSDLDARAKQWTTWSNPTAKRAKVGLSTTNSVGDSVASKSTAKMACCLLCRRKFPTIEALSRHETLSKLHLANLQGRQTKKSDDGP